MNIGQRIRDLRRLKKISGTRLAELVGVSQAQISRYETGENEVPLSMLQRICDALGITLADFFAPAGQGAEPLSPELRRLLENARELSPEQLAALERMIQAFKR